LTKSPLYLIILIASKRKFLYLNNLGCFKSENRA
jgi:hypothetical protein